ncbi:hypothetical protein ACKAV7_003284 [Fusarium commune]
MAADLVVGIDIGMTGTGVAYKLKRDRRPTALEWGRDEKLPTRLFYSDRHQPPKLVGWGLEVPDDSEKPFTTREWFKVDFGNRDTDQTHVESLYIDFLGCLYQELRLRQFTPRILGGKSFEECTINFLFSVPATWDPALDGDNVLIVDAGGGTTDFCLLKVQDNLHGTTEVHKSSQAIEIQPVSACEVGSVNIDKGFEDLVKEHFECHRGLFIRSLEQVAWHIRDSDDYRDCKHNFGTEGFDDFTFAIPFHKTNPGESPSLVRIDPFILTERASSPPNPSPNGSDSFLEVIKAFLTELEKRRETADTGRNYIILAGGLGSSPYFKGKIQQLVAKSLAKFAEKTEVFTSDDPRLTGTPVGDLDFFTFTQKATFSPDLPEKKRIWEVAILTSFESDTERLMVEDNCRIRSILNIDLSQAPQAVESTGTREALSRLHLARKPDVVIKFTVVVRVGLATIEFQWVDSKGFRCSDPISIPTGDERPPSTGQSAVHELS